MEGLMTLDLVLPRRLTKLCVATKQEHQFRWHSKKSSGNLHIVGRDKDTVRLEFTGYNFLEVKENIISCVIDSITKKRNETDQEHQEKVKQKKNNQPASVEVNIRTETTEGAVQENRVDTKTSVTVTTSGIPSVDTVTPTWRRSSRRVKPNVKEEFLYDSLKDLKANKKLVISDEPDTTESLELEDEAVSKDFPVDISSKKVPCKVCKVSVSNLRMHMLSRHITLCPHCKREIKKKDFKDHLKTSHPGLVLTELCPVCMKPFKSLKKHITAKHSGRLHHDHVCKQCGYATYDRHALRNHILHVHHNVRMFSCSSCSQTFKTKQVLKQHTRIVHEGVRDFQCHVCMKKFTKKYHLDVHTRTHMGEKPYLCSYCPRQFTDKANLDVHTETVHLKVYSYQCSVCDQLFRRKKYLVEHIRGSHPNAEKLLQQGVGKLTQPKSKPVCQQSQGKDTKKYGFTPQSFQIEVGQEVSQQVAEAGITNRNLAPSSFKLEVAEAMLNINPVERQPSRYLVHLPGGKRLVLSPAGTAVNRVQQQHQQININVNNGRVESVTEETQNLVEATENAVEVTQNVTDETSGTQLATQSQQTAQEISILELVQQVVHSTGNWTVGGAGNHGESIAVEVPYSSDTQHEETTKTQHVECDNTGSEGGQVMESRHVNVGDTQNFELCIGSGETGSHQQHCIDTRGTLQENLDVDSQVEVQEQNIEEHIESQAMMQRLSSQEQPGGKSETVCYSDSSSEQQQTIPEIVSESSDHLEHFSSHGDSVIVVPEQNGQEITLTAEGYIPL
ncbi:zinc finger and BTB domain-containing protein 24-like [Lingula anatina]|uniref:Zinc finger and BTB domain-containing protein 24-like n=1 Tax=Lingula anatina TaxID=7574 RepID=A0A2R2MTC7_LINAN|nr:zinc finger and BTB domain-containing protein 24-like [Lingula anatina]|eukprot:XP_023933520.1 zinc finger and BTB domain-containing protein 24-like [Lingula anatina]